ncbi:hypothetical protein JOC86_001684 [Bacillus pakistanensis]|uniref:DUF4178 domain-containing protein n=1 Tax=Rossellomorea pakistanensis TaxID=992288 RepID=A0ABS2NB98_9BACI|nr:DUF4178 domain-containing protein [Bacillus pakistanensis]MBM7585142.1 hypothetical protein [Bacillus pakistanensis]
MSFFTNLFGKKEKKIPEVKERDILSIEVGDIVSYDLEDYQVVGKLIYEDHGFEWLAYQLQSPAKTLWLSAEMDDELYVGIYEKIKLKLQEPFPKKLEHDGIRFNLDESGVARVRGEGRGKNVNNIQCKYYDYCDDEEEQFLSIEVWGSEVEVSYGYEIEEYEIKIIASK